MNKPLKVTIRFITPFVHESEYPKYLDALLAKGKVIIAEQNGCANAWSEGDILPLEKAGENADWVWKASRLIFTPMASRILVNQQRKSDPAAVHNDFDEGLWRPKGKEWKTPPKINTQSGQNRAYQIYTATQWMEKAVAWCVGDKDEIEKLLSQLPYIGKQGRNGWGLVESFTVEECPEANEGWKLRVLPSDIVGASETEYAPVYSAPRAPYWNKQARCMMMEPII